MKAAPAAMRGVDPIEAVAWLAVAVALLFLNPYGDFGPESDRFLVLAALAVVSAGLAMSGRARAGAATPILRRSPAHFAAAAFVVAALISTATAIDRWRSVPGAPPRLTGLAADLALAALFLAFASRAREATAARLESAIALAGGAMAAYAAVQWSGFDPMSWSLDWQGRPVGAQGNPLFLAQALVWIAPLLAARALARWREERRGEAVVAGIFAALAVAVAARTGARAALAGLAVAAVVLALARGAGGPLLRFARRPVAVAIASSLLLGGLTLWGARAGATLEGTSGQRALLWRAAIDRLETASPLRWLVGFGPDSGSIALASVVPPELPERIWRPDLYQDRAHNAALDALLAGGALRAAALLALYAIAIAGAARRVELDATPEARARATGWLAALAGHGVAVSVGIATAATALFVWLTLAVGAGARSEAEEAADERPAPRLQATFVLLIAIWSGWVPAQVGGTDVALSRSIHLVAIAVTVFALALAISPKRGRFAPFLVAVAFLALHAVLVDGARFGLALAALVAFAGAAIVRAASPASLRPRSAVAWAALATAALATTAIAFAIDGGMRLKSGRTALAAGDATAAERLLEPAAERLPFFEEVAVALARARLRAAERTPDAASRERGFAAADAALVAGERFHPEIATFPLERAYLESRRGEMTVEPSARRRRFERSVELFHRALALEPQASVAHRGLGAARLELGEIEAAREALREAVRLAPRSVESRLMLARADLAGGDIERGRAGIAAATAIDAGRARRILVAIARARPDDATAYRDLALLDLAEGHPERARAALQQAMSVAEPAQTVELRVLLALASDS